MNKKIKLLTLFFVIHVIFYLNTGLAFAADDDITNGLVGRWEFDNGTGNDYSGNGNDAHLGGAEIYDLGDGFSCLKVMPNVDPVTIPVREDSKLAIKSGTVCFWVNQCWGEKYPYFIDYDNRAIQVRSYRRYLQPRFQGENDFRFSGNILDDDWMNFETREDAFYPHALALLPEGQWHHFAVSYDYDAKKITGWRDGELIALADLSTVEMEPLKTDGLSEIRIAQHLAGFMDDIRIYDTILTDQELTTIYNARKTVYQSRKDWIEGDKKLEVYQLQEGDSVLYDAWLHYPKTSNKTNNTMLRQIIMDSENPTIMTAREELSKAVSNIYINDIRFSSKPEKSGNVLIGTPETSLLIHDMTNELGLDRVQHDGFVLKTLIHEGKSYLVIGANEPAGVIYGTFALIRRIKMQCEIKQLDIIENPEIAIRLVNHWDFFRGFRGDDWHGKKINPYNWESNRYNSIYSWEDLRTGNVKLITDWARLLSSAGWNAICPTEINWEFRNNFLEHLDEVKIMAGIFRKYGIKLYWSPNYLLAQEKTTADSLYAYIPDFGGYLLKLGSEAQLGNPFPEMVNKIASNLKPYGGHALVRGFVYGKHRYAHITEVFRNTMQYDIYVPNDGAYLDNVIIVGKANPLDWDLAAPISPLDGAIRQTKYGTEMVIAKGWPASWLEKWKWWLHYDNLREGPGSLNKNYIKCLMGVSMISPSPGWTSSPLNMVNYYGLGRLAWDPDLSIEQVYNEWIRLTFGNDEMVCDTINKMLLLSDDVLRNQYIYRGYRGVWFDVNEDDLIENKTTHIMNTDGIGIMSPEAEEKVLKQYPPELQEIFNDPVQGEEFLPYFHFVEYDYTLTNGRSVIKDLFMNLDDAVNGAQMMHDKWTILRHRIDDRIYEYTEDNLVNYIKTVKKNRERMIQIIERISGRTYEIELEK